MFRLNRNERSHWSGNGVHVEPESVFMISRNMHLARISVMNKLVGLGNICSPTDERSNTDAPGTYVINKALNWLLEAQTCLTSLVSTNDLKWPCNCLGMCPPEMSSPTSIFFSMACPVRFALVMKHSLSSATTTLA